MKLQPLGECFPQGRQKGIVSIGAVGGKQRGIRRHPQKGRTEVRVRGGIAIYLGVVAVDPVRNAKRAAGGDQLCRVPIGRIDYRSPLLLADTMRADIA